MQELMVFRSMEHPWIACLNVDGAQCRKIKQGRGHAVPENCNILIREPTSMSVLLLIVAPQTPSRGKHHVSLRISRQQASSHQLIRECSKVSSVGSFGCCEHKLCIHMQVVRRKQYNGWTDVSHSTNAGTCNADGSAEYEVHLDQRYLYCKSIQDAACNPQSSALIVGVHVINCNQKMFEARNVGIWNLQPQLLQPCCELMEAHNPCSTPGCTCSMIFVASRPKLRGAAKVATLVVAISLQVEHFLRTRELCRAVSCNIAMQFSPTPQ